MQKIIIDTDPGVDDAQAIAFALAHPSLSLLGLTTVFGNASIERTTENALQILQQFGHDQVPVAKGAAQPISQARLAAPDFVHGEDGLGNLHLTAPTLSAVTESAAEFIIRQANEQPGEITLIAIGPLTNIAQAVMLDPSLPSKVKELVIMGGTVAHPGNVTPLAEANFINDPHAADVVCAYDWPLTIIGLDVTLQVMLRDEHLAQLRDQAATTGKLIWDSSRFYVDFYTTATAKEGDTNAPRQCAMHDASAVVYLLARDAFELESGPARVVPDGIAVGQLALCRDAKTREQSIMLDWQGRPDVHAAMKVDAGRVLQLFLDTLIAHG